MAANPNISPTTRAPKFSSAMRKNTSRKRNDRVAQWIRCLTTDQKIPGSSPGAPVQSFSTILNNSVMQFIKILATILLGNFL